MLRSIISLTLLGCGQAPPPPTYDAGPPPSDTCGSVRLTSYDVVSGGWCEYDRALPALPTFVRSGFTAAIAEPWNGGSYGGEPGEACGECWELDTIGGTQTIMITDLCPIAGNPLCAGAHFHFDLATEAAAALGGGGLDEGTVRRVPCPVEGNVSVHVKDESDGYLRFAFLSHRFPIRSVELRGGGDGVAADNPWIAARRSGGAWEAFGDGQDLARGGTGVVFRLNGAHGASIESTAIVPAHPANGSTFDLGVQFADAPPPGSTCVFTPPADVYVDGFGGIDQVRWMLNPWGAAETAFAGEVTELCASGSCLQIDRLDQWSGFHLYYRQAFPTTTFARVALRARTVSGTGQIAVSPGNDSARCQSTMLDVGESYAEVVVDIAAVCAGVDTLSLVTIDNPGPNIALVIDDVRFER